MGRPSKPHRTSNGTWRFRFQRRCYWFPRRLSEAAVWAELAKLQRAAGGEPRGAVETYPDLVHAWYIDSGNDWAKRMAEKFNTFTPELMLDELDPYVVQRFAQWLKHGALRPKTIRHHVSATMSVLRWGIAHAHLDELPRPPKLEPSQRFARDIPHDDLRAVFNHLPECAERPLRFLLLTGCRPGEACRLAWSDVDLDKKLVILEAHKTARATGKPRTIYLSPDALALLKSVEQRHGPVFLSRLGRPYTSNGLHAAMRRASFKALRRHIHPYQLRHTAAVHMLESGNPPEVVAAMLGHESLAMVWFYARVRSHRLRQAAANLVSPLSVDCARAASRSARASAASVPRCTTPRTGRG